MKKNYPFLSIFQYLFSLGVIVVHCGSLFPHPIWHFVAKSIWGRQAVPFFLLTTGYFLCQSQRQSPQALAVYLSKQLKTYLKWSLFYLPYALIYAFSIKVSPALLPLALIVALLYTGTCYQLWYFPALFLGLFLVNAGRQHLSRKALFLICLSLYLLGSVETYMGYLEGTWLGTAYQLYASVFLTSRNGLFFTPLFLFLGQYLFEAYNQPIFSHQSGIKLGLSGLVFAAEGYLIYCNQGVDKNFFLTLPVFSLFLLNWSLRTSHQLPFKTDYFKRLSGFCFFLHPVFVEWARVILEPQGLPSWQEGQLLFLAGLIGSHFPALLWLRKKTI